MAKRTLTLTDAFPAIRPYLAEIGGVGFVGAGVVLVVGVAVDHWRPGTLFSYLAPQHLAVTLLAFGALACLRDTPAPRGFAGTVRTLAVGAASAMGAHAAAGRYFSSLGDAGDRLALAAALAAFLPFVLFRTFGKDDDRHQE